MIMQKRRKCVIGYLGCMCSNTILKSIKDHHLFTESEIELLKYDNNVQLKRMLKYGKITHAVVPSRDLDNNLSPVIVDMLNSLDSNNIIEIGTFFADSHDILEIDSNSVPATSLGTVEYKIFKKSEYRTSIGTYMSIQFFANSVFQKVLLAITVILALFTIAVSVLDLFQIQLFPGAIPERVSALITAGLLIMQAIFAAFKLETKARKKLITGYWVYYSFEEDAATKNYVPKGGLRTRLLTISDEDGELNFRCRFSGEDGIFFATSKVTFDYNYRSRIGSGFYDYTTNTLNNNKKRAEGLCYFRGEWNRGKPFTSMDGWFSSRGTSINGMVKYIRISKEEYDILMDSSSEYARQFEKERVILVGVYGDPYSNTHLAAIDASTAILKEFPDQDTIIYYFMSSVRQMKEYLQSMKIDVAVVPLYNRGRVIEEHNVFVERNKKSEWKPFKIDKHEIKYVLASTKKEFVITKDTIFIGHPQSINQCKAFLKGHTTELKISSSTAAKELFEAKTDDNRVAICNKSACDYYGLFPIRNDSGDIINPYVGVQPNITTFYFYKKKSVK